MGWRDITRGEVLRAIAECDRLGREEFLNRYGFDRARTYMLLHDGMSYDSKAIVGAAHGFLPGERPLAPGKFSGGRATVVGLLRRLGFTVTGGGDASDVLARLGSLNQHQQDGNRSPHRPLLALLAIGRLANTGSSELPWSLAEVSLADLITEFGQSASPVRAQSAAYPFTRLRADGVWTLDAQVPNDRVRPLNERNVTGRLEPTLEAALRAVPALVNEAARMLVTGNFPDTIAPHVLRAVGLDPATVLSVGTARPDVQYGSEERRDRRIVSELADYVDLTTGRAAAISVTPEAPPSVRGKAGAVSPGRNAALPGCRLRRKPPELRRRQCGPGAGTRPVPRAAVFQAAIQRTREDGKSRRLAFAWSEVGRARWHPSPRAASGLHSHLPGPAACRPRRRH